MWKKFSLVAQKEVVSLWVEAFTQLGVLSVSVEDAEAEKPEAESFFQDISDPLMEEVAWKRSLLTILVPESTVCVDLLAKAAELIEEPIPEWKFLESFKDEDWVRKVQDQFQPIEVGSSFLITPSWHLGTPASELPRNGMHRIVIDPELAFGTGRHVSTQLCMEWISDFILQMDNPSFIDYGCGSGILSIAAAKLGAGPVYAMDIDPDALAVARKNAVSNNVEVIVQATTPPRAQVVCANILANPLNLLAPLLCSLVLEDGYLVLSGILNDQAFDLIAVYEKEGIKLEVFSQREGWSCLVGQR